MKKERLLLLLIYFSYSVYSQPAKLSVSENVEFITERLSTINTIGSDISPAFVGNQLYFSGVNEKYIDKKSRERKNMAYYSIYSSELDSNGITSTPRTLVSGFGSKYHEGPVSFCAVTGELFTTLSNTINPDTIQKMFPSKNIRLRIVIKKQLNGQWVTIEEFPFNDKHYNFAHPAISITGDTLIFCSDVDSISKGKTDLFMSVRSNGKWLQPVNLGDTINTPGNEMFPTFLPGGLLAFSSDGRNINYGSLDIYYTKFPEIGKVINAGDKINSNFDDFGLVIHPNKTVGYFSSNRPGIGSDDVYRLDIIKLYKTFKGKVVDDHLSVPIESVEIQLFDCNDSIIATTITDKDGNFEFEVLKSKCPTLDASKSGYEKIHQDIEELNYTELRMKKIDQFKYLTIDIIDKSTGLIIPNAVLNILNLKYNTSENVKTDKGVIRIKLEELTNYTFYASAKEYFGTNINYINPGKIPGEYFLKIELEQLVSGKQFVLDNLYYDLNKYNIRSDAAIVLNRLVEILANNPEIRIKIGSHTDCRASSAYNQKLSQKRSDSVMAYLISKGIAPSRLEAVGYGESQLINKCADGIPCTEEEHQKNRRTVITILNTKRKN